MYCPVGASEASSSNHITMNIWIPESALGRPFTRSLVEEMVEEMVVVLTIGWQAV